MRNRTGRFQPREIDIMTEQTKTSEPAGTAAKAKVKAKTKAKTKVAASTKKTTAAKAAANTAAKKTATKKASAKSTARKRGPSADASAASASFKDRALAKTRTAIRVGLGVYGTAYDQLQEQFENLQKQVDDAQLKLNARREQAEALYASLVARGTAVESDALKAFSDLELDALTDRKALEAQMAKAKQHFDDLRQRLVKAR
jgi:chromosome segregation ATPase